VPGKKGMSDGKLRRNRKGSHKANAPYDNYNEHRICHYVHYDLWNISQNFPSDLRNSVIFLPKKTRKKKDTVVNDFLDNYAVLILAERLVRKMSVEEGVNLQVTPLSAIKITPSLIERAKKIAIERRSEMQGFSLLK